MIVLYEVENNSLITEAGREGLCYASITGHLGLYVKIFGQNL